MRRAAGLTVLLCLGVLVPSCRAPTEITLVLSTDVKCADVRGTSVTVGRLGDIETKAATATSTFCDASGDLGALVVVPSGGKSDEVAMKVIAGVGRDAEACVPPYAKGCIVARRALHYLPHTPLRVELPLRAACDGVPCAETETCVSGACAPAQISDPGVCSGPNGCDEGALGTATTADGGTDGLVGAAPFGGGPIQQTSVGWGSMTFTISLPTAAVGNALIAVIGVNGNAVASVSGGGVDWKLAVASNVNRDIEIWYGLDASGAGGSVVVTMQTTNAFNAQANISEWRGVTRTEPAIEASAPGNGTSADMTTPTITPASGTSRLLIAGSRTYPAGETFTSNSPGWSSLETSAADRNQAAYLIVPVASGGYSNDFKWSAVEVYDVVVAAFDPDTGR